MRWPQTWQSGRGVAAETSECWLVQRSHARKVRRIWTMAAGEEFEGFGDLDAGGEVGGGVEDSGGLAGFDPAGGRGGEEAGEAGGFAGEDVHAGGVGANGGGVNPRTIAIDAEIVDEVAGLVIVGGVEDELGILKQGQGGGDEVGNVGGDGDIGVDGGEFAAGGFGFREGIASVGFVIEHLALEVAVLDEVAVNEGEVADAGAGEKGGGGSSGGSAADDGDVRLQRGAAGRWRRWAAKRTWRE